MTSCPDWRVWLLALLALLPLEGLAIELEQLFLPRSYIRYLPAMLDAAREVEQLERCERFIKGELQTDQSRLEQPVFRFFCRDPQQRTFALLVDGVAQEVMDVTRPGGRVSFTELQREYSEARERERQLQAQREQALHELQQLSGDAEWDGTEEQRLLQELRWQQELLRRATLWQHCRARLEPQVRNMLELVWITQEVDTPSLLSDERLRFDIDFDARDLAGRALRYRAQCDIVDVSDYQLRIRPRHLAEQERLQQIQAAEEQQSESKEP